MRQDGFLIGRWHVDPAANMISSGGETIRLQPRFMRVLTLLAERQGEVLTREELLDQGWPNVIVQEAALTQAIFHLRAAMGPVEGAYIQTIPKVGYRLDVPGPVGETPAESATTSRPSVWIQAALTVLAVLALVVVINSLRPFGSYGGGNLEISRVTSAKGQEVSPAINPTGTAVVYSKWMSESGVDLFLQDLSFDTPIRLTDAPGNDVNPEWTASGQSIAFARKTEDTCQITLVDIHDGRERVVRDCTIGSWPTLAWSPGGDRVAISDRLSSGDDYAIVLVDATSFEPISDPIAEAGVSYRRPVFLNDDELVFAAYEEGYTGSIRRFRIGENRVEKLFAFEGPISGLAYQSNAGRLLVSGKNDVFRADFQGRGSWQLVRATDPSADLSGDKTVYTQWETNTNIYRIDLVSGDSRIEVAASTQVDRSPKWSNAFDRIAFISNRTGDAQLWMSGADGSDPVRMTGAKLGRIENFDWSADDETIVVVAVKEGLRELDLLDVETGEVRPLVGSRFDPQIPTWTEDGTSILFRGGADDLREVMRVSADGGKPASAGIPLSSYAVQSADDALYYTRFDTSGIWTRRSGSPRLLIDDALSDHAWSIADGRLFYLRGGTEGDIELVSRDLATDSTSVVRVISDRLARGRSIDVSSDGNSILLTVEEETESDIIMLSVSRSR